MNTDILIAIARQLVKIDTSEMPHQDELRKAIGIACYALFHALCHCVADPWVGADDDLRGNDAWVQAYRLLEHGKIKAACIKILNVKNYPKELKYIARIFKEMQRLRHLADYDPNSRFSRSEAIEAIYAVEEAIRKLMNADKNDRLAFVTFLAFPHRKD